MSVKPKAELPSTTAAQRAKLLAALRRGPITTIAARRELDILMPGARVHELRHRGFNIITHWARQHTDAGVSHRVARYVLLSAHSPANQEIL